MVLSSPQPRPFVPAALGVADSQAQRALGVDNRCTPSSPVNHRPVTNRPGTLPTVGLVTPNLIDDAHDGTLGQADAWLRQWIPVIMSGRDWRDGRLAIAVVFDEADTGNQVPLVLIAPWLSGAVIHQPLDHYALTRLIDTVIGAPPLRQAAIAQYLRLKLRDRARHHTE
jgi:hypothetical protein